MGGKDGDRFGLSLSFSPDSNLLAVGAYQRGNDGPPGYVNIYFVDENGHQPLKGHQPFYTDW